MAVTGFGRGRPLAFVRGVWRQQPSAAVGVVGLCSAGLFAALKVALRVGQPFDVWQTGDWLINYSGGFVRRGLLGQAIQATSAWGFDVVWVATLAQIGFMAALYVLVGILYWGTDRGWAWTMAVLSPAFLLFPVLNEKSEARKEIVVLVALALMAVYARYGRPRWLIVASFGTFLIGGLSHEAMVATVGAFVILVVGSSIGASRRQTMVLVALFSIAALAIALLGILYRGDAEVMRAVCESWREQGVSDCSRGAITYFGVGTVDAIRQVANMYAVNLRYVPLAVLAATPLVLVGLLPRHWRRVLIVVVPLMPLFVLGLDYGRWIYLISGTLTIVALGQSQLLGLVARAVPAWVAIAFVGLWSLPAFGLPDNNPVVVRIVESAVVTGLTLLRMVAGPFLPS